MPTDPTMGMAGPPPGAAGPPMAPPMPVVPPHKHTRARRGKGKKRGGRRKR